MTIGHEFSGIIEEVGEGVERLKVGDRVCVRPTIYDNECRACRKGLNNCCDSNGFVGLSGWGGGASDHCVVPEASAHKLPPEVSYELGALVEPLSVGWHAVDISPYEPLDTVLVLGGGPIGLAVVQALKAKKASKIIVSEIAPARKEFAKKFGAHFIIDPVQENVVERVKEINDGAGADVAFDCAGVQIGLDTAMKAVRARGTVVNIAVWEKRATLNMNDLVFRERKYIGVATFLASDFESVIDAIATGTYQARRLDERSRNHVDILNADRHSGKMTPEGMITRKIKLNEVEEKGYRSLIDDKDNHVKILIDVEAPF